MRTVIARGGLAVAMGISMSTASLALAQGTPTRSVPAPARPSAGAAPAAGAPATVPPASPAPGVAPATGVVPSAPSTGTVEPVSGPASAAVHATATNDETTPVAVPQELVQAREGGLTADQAGIRASLTSWNAKASEEAVRSAAAQVDATYAAFLPRLSGRAEYQRLSEFTPPSIALLPPGVSTGDPTIDALLHQGFSFPLVFNNWTFQATLTVPISDYFLSIDQKYTAATKSEEAARWDLAAARATALSDGKVSYYTWLRNRGAVIVAAQALNDQKSHLKDAQNQFTVGNASKADVLRAETAVAAAELTVEQATNLSDLTEKQLRVAMHAPDEQAFAPGEDLAVQLQPFQGNLQQMTTEALSTRAEIKSADANAESATKQASAAKASRYPSLSAYADGLEANPNPRYFPATQDWHGTWDVGARLTWSPNDILTANASAKQFDAQVAQIKANQNNTRDGIIVEVQQYWQGVREADFAVDSSTREVTSAEEAYRVQRELFNNGRGTSATLTDAESDLTKARLDLLNARANARIARIRLDHALGRDVKPVPASGSGGGSDH
jgi:outer membrane protein TolC